MQPVKLPRSLTSQEEANIKAAFSIYDPRGSGDVSASQLKVRHGGNILHPGTFGCRKLQYSMQPTSV